MFCWGCSRHARGRAEALADGRARLVAIGAAVLARTQFVVLLGCSCSRSSRRRPWRRPPPRAARELWRTRRPFVVFFGTLLLVVLAAIAIDKGSRLLGSYSVTAENVRLDFGLAQLLFEHVAVLALGLAILPFIVGAGWLIDRVRPSAALPERAFAVVGCAALLLLVVQVASFNQRFGAGLVKDRYLFYVVPILLLGPRRGRRPAGGRAGGRSWCRRRPRSASSRCPSRRTRSSTSTRSSRC